MRVRFTESARSDLEELLARIAADNAAAAAAVSLSIKEAIVRLSRFPRIGAETDQPGIFMKIVRPYRYLIFYRIDESAIVIRNVRHPARARPSEQC
jgi:plasmid stabilization system protein ParE